MGSGMPYTDGAAGSSSGGRRSRSTRRGPSATPACTARLRGALRAVRGPLSRATQRTAKTPVALGTRASTGSLGPPFRGFAVATAVSGNRSTRRLRVRTVVVARPCAGRIAVPGSPVCGGLVAFTLGVRVGKAVPKGTTKGPAATRGTPMLRGPSGRSCPVIGASGPSRSAIITVAGHVRRCTLTRGTPHACGISVVYARAAGLPVVEG